MTTENNPEGQLLTLDAVTGKPPTSRISDAEALRVLFKKVWDSDAKSSKDRAAVDAMFGGESPYPQKDLDDLGQSDRTNLNFNEALAIADQAESGYYDLTNSVPELISVKTSFGNPFSRLEWEQIIAEEWTRMVRNWPKFEFVFQRLVKKFNRHGVGVSYFTDDVDWRPETTGFDTFKIPRGTPATEDSVEVAFCKLPILAHQLYKNIKDPKVAADAGWDVDLVRKAILRAANSEIQDDAKKYSDWEKFERQIQSNDLATGYAKAAEISTVHAWIQEFDGTVTHCITTEGDEGKEFMFRRIGRFSNIHEAITIFTYGIGSGFYHTIRGLGYKIFPHIAVSNRLRCAAVDGAVYSSTVTVQPIDQNARSLEDLTVTTIGPWSVLPPGLKIVERAMPNFGQNVLPVVNDMATTLRNNVGQYQSNAAAPDGGARTAYEIRASLSREAVLGSASMNLFYAPWKRLLSEMFYRSANRDLTVADPGGREVFEFRRKISERGVPLEALYQVFSVEPVRSVGMGSASMRSMALDEAMSLASSMDEAGRTNLMRDRLASRFGYDGVDRYVPRPEASMRPPIDQKVAELENAVLKQGQPVTVIPSENHSIHANMVLNLLAETLQAVQQGQMQLPQSLAIFQAALPHAQAHISALVSDPLHQRETALMRQALQQVGASAQRISDEFQARQQEQQQAQQAEQQRRAEAQQAYVRELEQKAGAGQQASPELQKTLETNHIQLEAMVAKHNLEMKITEERAAQDLAIKDAQSASKILDKGNSAVANVPQQGIHA